VMRDDVLVGGDDRLAHREGGGDERVGRFVAAHQLDDDVDLVIGDEMSLRDWLKTAPEASCCTAAGRVDDPERIAGEGFAIVFRKGDDGLKQKFDAALKELRGDGSYATIARRYFDFDPL